MLASKQSRRPSTLQKERESVETSKPVHLPEARIPSLIPSLIPRIDWELGFWEDAHSPEPENKQNVQ
jgi:hypothetical protein